MKEKNKEQHCSFCGTKLSEDDFCMMGIEAVICELCIEIYYQIFDVAKHQFKTKPTQPITKPILTPHQIYQQLEKEVIGQTTAKKTLAVGVYNHYQRINQNLTDVVEKSNILMIGPSGSGKTLLAKSLAKIIDVPFVICDATVYTEAGYVGEDVENILLKLLQKADYDLAKAEQGIVFLDEIDKIARKGENLSITRDVSGEGVQNSLLKIIEGSIINIPPKGGRKHPYQEYISFDTSNVLFICAGAFEGLIAKTKKPIGIHQPHQVIKHQVSDHQSLVLSEIPDKLIKYGIIPELIGRLPIITILEPLTKEELKTILTKPNKAILKQYQALLKLNQIELDVTDEAIELVANFAQKGQSGARSLKRIIEPMILDLMYQVLIDQPKVKLNNQISAEKNAKIVVTPDLIKEYCQMY